MIIGFVLIQFIPYGKQHTNPPIISEPKWSDSKTRQIAERACFSCHSNQTEWPWYSAIAPTSWLVQSDVVRAREVLNFTEWETKNLSAEYVVNVIQQGNMPPFRYIVMHPEANLSQIEKEAFIKGLLASLKIKAD